MFFPRVNATFRARLCCCCVCLDPAKTFNHADWWGAFSWLKASPSLASIPAVHQPSNPFIKPLIVLRYTRPLEYPFLCTAAYLKPSSVAYTFKLDHAGKWTSKHKVVLLKTRWSNSFSSRIVNSLVTSSRLASGGSPPYESGPAQGFFLLEGSVSCHCCLLGVRPWVSVKSQETILIVTDV